MLWRKIIIYVLLIATGFNLGAVFMLGKELRFARFSIMIFLLALALIFASSEQKISKTKINGLKQELLEKEKIINNARERLNKIIGNIKV